jgi:uncharacterized protein YceK
MGAPRWPQPRPFPLAAGMQCCRGMRNMMIAVMAVGVLAGCGTVHRGETTYTKPGMTNARLAADQNVCRQQAVGQAESKSLPSWGQTMNRQAYDDCMRGLGYAVDAASASPRW